MNIKKKIQENEDKMCTNQNKLIAERYSPRKSLYIIL